MKIFSGFTSKTAENLQLDAGVFFRNFTLGTDTYETALTSGKCIGATRDGGSFLAKPETRVIEIDGIKGRAKGLTVIDGWEVQLSLNTVELTKGALQLGLGAATAESTKVGEDSYTKLEGKAVFGEDDYLDNVTWLGTLSGSDKPIIIQVYNALSTEGLSLDFKDKDNGVIAITCYGHYLPSADIQKPPFSIFYPDDAAV